MRSPVVFFIFNRPEQTRRVFAEIAKARPPKLLVAADGPRPGVSGDAARCAAARAVVDQVTWDCDVATNYADTNLGCGQRVASALTWAFDRVEEAIILEDDTLPIQDFFVFCDAMLEYYRDDERVMHVSGNNFHPALGAMGYSYYFSCYDHIWGWATWRRAFRHYDFPMSRWQTLRTSSWLSSVLGDPVAAEWWTNYFDRGAAGDRTTYDSWDCQWLFAILVQHGLAITPHANLVSNIGFGVDATHTRNANSSLALIPGQLTWPLRHPPHMVRHTDAERAAFALLCKPEANAPAPSLSRRLRNRLIALLS